MKQYETKHLPDFIVIPITTQYWFYMMLHHNRYNHHWISMKSLWHHYGKIWRYMVVDCFLRRADDIQTRWYSMIFPVPPGKQTVCYWKWPLIVYFPIENDDFLGMTGQDLPWTIQWWMEGAIRSYGYSYHLWNEERFGASKSFPTTY